MAECAKSHVLHLCRCETARISMGEGGAGARPPQLGCGMITPVSKLTSQNAQVWGIKGTVAEYQPPEGSCYEAALCCP
eukprot:6180547-Pleurochrysis_carterae.AAC.1